MDGWVWSNGGMILTGETWSTGRKTLYIVGGRWMNGYGAMVEWYWKGKTEVLGEKHYTLCVVDGWMGMEQWWNDTDRRNTNRYKILSERHINHYKYHMPWLRIQSCFSHWDAFPNNNIPQTYFASVFCFQVLYIHIYIYIYIYTHTHTPTHNTWILVLCVCVCVYASCQLQSYYGALCATHSMHTVRQYKGHFCYTLYSLYFQMNANVIPKIVYSSVHVCKEQWYRNICVTVHFQKTHSWHRSNVAVILINCNAVLLCSPAIQSC